MAGNTRSGDGRSALDTDGGDAWGGALERHGPMAGRLRGGVLVTRNRAVAVLDRWRDDVDKLVRPVEHGEGASDGRGREHEFRWDADVHAGYDSGDARGMSLSKRHGHEQR